MQRQNNIVQEKTRNSIGNTIIFLETMHNNKISSPKEENRNPPAPNCDFLKIFFFLITMSFDYYVCWFMMINNY